MDCQSGENPGIIKSGGISGTLREIECIKSSDSEKEEVKYLIDSITNDVEKNSLERDIEIYVIPRSYGEDIREDIKSSENIEEIFFTIDTSDIGDSDFEKIESICKEIITSKGYEYNSWGESYTNNSLVVDIGGLTTCMR